MKKIALLIATLFTVTALSACGDICVGPECITGETGGEVVAKDEKAIQFTHIDGHGNVVEMTAYILFEVELRDYVKYQLLERHVSGSRQSDRCRAVHLL
jgi:hypothetical protein